MTEDDEEPEVRHFSDLLEDDEIDKMEPGDGFEPREMTTLGRILHLILKRLPFVDVERVPKVPDSPTESGEE